MTDFDVVMAEDGFRSIVQREDETAELRAEIELLKTQLREHAAFQMFQRFHAFDAIKDDRCPSCGGPVQVVETDNSVMLKTKWKGVLG